MDTSVLWAEADIFERDVPEVKVGQEASLVLRPFKEWRAAGIIKGMSADLHPQKRTAHVWIEIENEELRLMPQMAVDISILQGTRKQALTIPREALLKDQGETFVFVTNGDSFLRLQDPGDPRDYDGFSGDPSNRKVYVGHNITTDGASDTVLDDGITLNFRIRIPKLQARPAKQLPVVGRVRRQQLRVALPCNRLQSLLTSPRRIATDILIANMTRRRRQNQHR